MMTNNPITTECIRLSASILSSQASDIETSTETAMIMASFRLYQAIRLIYGGNNNMTTVIVSVLSTSAFSLKASYAMQLNVCCSKHQ